MEMMTGIGGRPNAALRHQRHVVNDALLEIHARLVSALIGRERDLVREMWHGYASSFFSSASKRMPWSPGKGDVCGLSP